MTHQICPDTTRRPDRPQPASTHWHGYLWTGSGQEWERLGRTDTLDVASPDRPPVRTAEWLRKSPRLLQGTWLDPAAARDWLVGEWEKACSNALTPVPDWVRGDDRAERALLAIRTGCWPSYALWLRGGMLVCMAVVGTADGCH